MIERLAGRFADRYLSQDRRLGRFLARHVIGMRRLTFAAALVLYPPLCVLSWFRFALRKALGAKPKLIWGPTPILNIVDNSKTMRELGYDSRTLVYTVYFITQDFDYNLARLVQNPAIGPWLPNLLFLWSLLRFDVFHFFYDGGIWSGMKILPHAKWLELPLLRLAGKRVVVMAYGADVRTRESDERWRDYNLCLECPEPGVNCICSDAAAEINTSYHRRWGNELVAMGDMQDYVFGSRRDVYHWPIDVSTVEYRGAAEQAGRPVRIVHSPNHRHFKGTGYIIDAVESLRTKGYDVELDLVEQVSNVEAKRRYGDGDIVVAQCVAGWVGFTEIEAMAAGKPTVTYFRDFDRYLEAAPGCPALSAHPGVLEGELERLVADAALREELGRRGRRYVEEHWSYEGVGRKYEETHERIWKNGELGKALRSVWSTFLREEQGFRVGRSASIGASVGVSATSLDEWPLWRDPQLALRRLAWEVHGEPVALDDCGMPLRRLPADRSTAVSEMPASSENGAAPRPLRTAQRERELVEDIGLVAQHAFDLWHAARGDAGLLERFAVAAEWLRERLVVDADGVGVWPTAKLDDHGRALGVLLRAQKLEDNAASDAAMRAAASAAFRGLCVPAHRGGLLDAAPASSDADFVRFWRGSSVATGSAGERQPSRSMPAFDAWFALSEAMRVFDSSVASALLERAREALRAGLGRLAGPLPASAGPGAFFGSTLPDRPGFGDDPERPDPVEWNRCATLFEALGQVLGDGRTTRAAARWKRELYRHKLKAFFSGKAPL